MGLRGNQKSFNLQYVELLNYINHELNTIGINTETYHEIAWMHHINCDNEHCWSDFCRMPAIEGERRTVIRYTALLSFDKATRRANSVQMARPAVCRAKWVASIYDTILQSRRSSMHLWLLSHYPLIWAYLSETEVSGTNRPISIHRLYTMKWNKAY